jgi:hypothetical protein
LRHLFMREPELNPAPFRHAPWVFFFLRTLVTVAIVAFTTAGVARNGSDHRRDFAWFTIAVVMLSTSIASYTFIVLLLPTVLLLDDAGPRTRFFVFALYFLLAFRLPMVWLFPKLWLMVAFYFVAGWTLLRRISIRSALAMATLAIVVAAVDAGRHMSQYANEPGQHFARVGVERGAMYSSFPVMTQAGVFYQSMGNNRYVLSWLHGGEHEKLAFSGHVLHPQAAADGRSVDFELVADGTSKMMRFDPSTRQLTASLLPVPPDAPVFAVSPDERWTAYESDQNGPTQIWLRDRRTGAATLLSGGNCNSTAPSWEPDSKAILFSSDCDRAYGLPALYRAKVSE